MGFLAKNICYKPHDMLIIRYSAFSMKLSTKVENFVGDFAGKFCWRFCWKNFCYGWLRGRERISAFRHFLKP